MPDLLDLVRQGMVPTTVNGTITGYTLTNDVVETALRPMRVIYSTAYLNASGTPHIETEYTGRPKTDLGLVLVQGDRTTLPQVAINIFVQFLSQIAARKFIEDANTVDFRILPEVSIRDYGTAVAFYSRLSTYRVEEVEHALDQVSG